MFCFLTMLSTSRLNTAVFVPQTAWTRYVMRFQSEHVLRHDWTEVETLRPTLDRVKTFKRTPAYFLTPLHGFKRGGICSEQALQQSASMRFIMRTFQCDEKYREHSYEDILSTLNVDTRGLAVDVGCGSGDSLLALDQNVVNPTIGFDLSRAMVKLARKRTGLKVYTSDAAHLPLPDNSVAVVTCFAVLHEMPREYANKLLSDMIRVVRENGHVIIWDQNPDTIGRLQHDMSDVPIEPYLLSYKDLDVQGELTALGCTVVEGTTRFMKHWIATKKSGSRPENASSFEESYVQAETLVLK